jgi:hypothetical protein
VRCGTWLHGRWWMLERERDAAGDQQHGQPGQRPPGPVAIAQGDVLDHAPEPDERRGTTSLLALSGVQDCPGLLRLADAGVVIGQMLIGLGQRPVRIPGEPAQPVTGWQPWLKGVVDQAVQAQLIRPARRVVAEDPDAGVAKVDSASDRLGRRERAARPSSRGRSGRSCPGCSSAPARGSASRRSCRRSAASRRPSTYAGR